MKPKMKPTELANNNIEEDLAKAIDEWPMSKLRELRKKLGFPYDFYNEDDMPFHIDSN